MYLRQFKVFLVAAERESFTQAAKELYLTQPAVSFQIQALEDFFGAKLFKRTGRKVELTDAGDTLLPYAKKIIDAMDESKKAIEQVGAAKTGKLVVGASTTIGIYILPPLIAIYRSKYPQTIISIRVENTEGIEEALLRKDIDFGLIEGFVKSSYVKREKFRDDELVLIVPAHHPWSDVIELSDLMIEPLILREEGSGTRMVLEGALMEKSLSVSDLNINMVLGNTEAIKHAVAAGLGVSFVSKCTIGKELALGLLRIVKVRGFNVMRELFIIRRENEDLSPYAERILRFLNKPTPIDTTFPSVEK
ncbi:MAG: selenium metabolism-associated LysR family transcriptional regulator [Thermodesulfobium sp.]